VISPPCPAGPRFAAIRLTPRETLPIRAAAAFAGQCSARSATLARVSRHFRRRFPALLAALLLAGTTLIPGCSKIEPPVAPEARDSRNRISRELAAQVAALEAREQQVAETAWAKELLAQECGRTFEILWDALNAATNKLDLVASFPIGEIVLGRWNAIPSLPYGIERQASEGPGRVLSPPGWKEWVEQFEHAGWQLVQTEFRHSRFEADASGQPSQSHFGFSAHLIHPARPERAVLEGELIVDWAPHRSDVEGIPVKRIDASHLTIQTRRGEPSLQPLLVESMNPPPNAQSIGPLLVYDLDADGRSEIILGTMNRVYHRRDGGRYESEPLCRQSPGVVYAALIADFDGDGSADYLCETYEGLLLFKGSSHGTFDEPGRRVWRAPPDLKSPFVLTCGDMDQDGDLDLFLAEYKAPYQDGAMPTPYYDARDGDPAYLLQNDGHGGFTDVTAGSGLEKNRRRRTYAASFVDLDDDGRLDLAVVSDFAGIGLYRNEGHGRFADVTSSWVAESHAFGMAHALADFNADGRLDLLMISMPSATVDRLEHLGLWRPDAVEDRAMRARMTYGNRLYLARPGGGFEQTPMSDSIARSGWSWGCSAFDFDNDGFPDVYIANGQDSRETVQDYEGEYWLHDLYVGRSEPDPAAHIYFQAKFGRTLERGQSYGGYEKNRFYLNRHGTSFVEIGHLLGVALEEDSRNVVADDLDGDGRVDLLVTSYEPWPSTRQVLRIYRNTLAGAGNWIGFRFCEEAGSPSPVGMRVALQSGGLRAVRQIVTGDSHRSQHPSTVHFGLGEGARVDTVELRWAAGQTLTLREPAVNRYHAIHAPAPDRAGK
jgi:enediyne biosynthesis protein E4